MHLVVQLICHRAVWNFVYTFGSDLNFLFIFEYLTKQVDNKTEDKEILINEKINSDMWFDNFK